MTDSASYRPVFSARSSVRMRVCCFLLMSLAVVVSAWSSREPAFEAMTAQGRSEAISIPALRFPEGPRLVLAQLPGAAIPDSVPDETSLPIGGSGAPGSAGSESVTVGLLRLFLALGIIGAASYAAIRIIKSRSRGSTMDPGLLRLAGSLTIAPGKSVHVVCLGDKAWLLASSESSTTLIDRVDDPVILERILAQSPVSPKPVRDVQGQRQEMDRAIPARREEGSRLPRPTRSGSDMRAHPDAEDAQVEDASRSARDLLRSQRERLERLRGGDS